MSPATAGLLVPSDAIPEGQSETSLGGKGLNLFHLKGLGFSVPNFWVVPTGIFEDCIASHRQHIHSQLSQVDFSDWKSVEQASGNIKQLILGLNLPPNLEDDIARALAQMTPDARFAVRSSGTAEDSAAGTFAGLFESFLCQPADAAPMAIKRVWASAYSARALLYMHRRNLSHVPISMAVIIQEMIPSGVSGVLFTRDPQDNSETCIITAAHGLGVGVVHDSVEVDTYRITWAEQSIERDVRPKARRVAMAETGGVRFEPLPSPLQTTSVLDDGQIRALCAIGRKLEESYGTPQDVEWTYDRDGTLWLLQSRPFAFAAETRPRRLWDNANIVESFSGLTLPLTFSFARQCYAAAFRNNTRRLLLGTNEHLLKDPVFDNLIGLIEGRVYYNMGSWRTLLLPIVEFSRRKKKWENTIGIGQIDAKSGGPVRIKELQLSPISLVIMRGILFWRLLSLKGTARRFFAQFEPDYARYRALDLRQFDEQRLAEHFHEIFNRISSYWHLTLVNDLCVIFYTNLLQWLVGRWLPEGAQGIYNDLLRSRSRPGDEPQEATSPALALQNLAKVFRECPEGRALLQRSSDRDVVDKLARDHRYRHLQEALDDYLNGFGDRVPEELKLEAETFHNRPDNVIDCIRAFLEANGEDALQRAITPRVPSAPLSVKNPFKRLAIGFVGRSARTAIGNRERMRLARSRMFGLARSIFRRLGALLQEKDILTDAADINYLTVDEVFDFVEGASVTRNLQALVDNRKAEYQRFADKKPPSRFFTAGVPYLLDVTEKTMLSSDDTSACGIGCVSGIAEGQAAVVYDPRQDHFKTGQILVAESTDPGWFFLMSRAAGIVIERGSLLSHSAILAREFGIPTVVGVADATQRIANGSHVIVNGTNGRVEWRA
jgi:pyruvate,water dikinase